MKSWDILRIHSVFRLFVHINNQWTGYKLLNLAKSPPPSVTYGPCTQWPEHICSTRAVPRLTKSEVSVRLRLKSGAMWFAGRGRRPPPTITLSLSPPNLPLSGPCQALFPGKGPSGQAQGPASGRAWLIEKNKNREGRWEDSPLHNSL